MAPLGILTIVVSAIRVGGPSWLKAIIGRARENLAAAEVELMSSTSSDVCELWNGSEIVWSLGSPPVREFILLIPKSPKDATRPFDFECKNIKEAEEAGFLTPSNIIEDSEKGRSMCSSGPLIIVYNESKSAPNVSLNVHSQKRAEVRAAAVIGTFLQLGVLIYAGFATYYHTLRFPKEENKPVSSYAFPCTASGTIILVTGLLLCADVVEKRTVEIFRKPQADYNAYVIWLQRQATVGDQVFKSFGIFSDEPRKEVVTSRPDISTVASEATEEHSVQFSKTTLGAFLGISGYIVQFVGLRDMHWSVSIVQLGAVVLMTAVRAAIRRGLAVPPRAQSLSQDFELEWLASITAGIDGSSLKIPQAESPDWINWVVSGDEGFILESLKDGRKDGEESEDDSDDDSENDTKEDSDRDNEGDNKDDGEVISDTEEGINDGVEEASRGRVGGDASNYSDDVQPSHGIGMEDEHQGGSVAARDNEGHRRGIYSKPQAVMTLRSHFGKVTGWRSPVFAEANSLSRAIEVVMNTLLLKSGLEHFDWQFQATCSNSDPQIITVPMSLVKGNWHVSRDDIQAILSLWILSMKNARKSESNLQNTDITTDRPGVHLLGLDTPQLRRDLRWWVPQDLKKAIVVRESPEGSLVVEKSLIVGRGRATQEAVKLERIQLGEEDSDPPYGQTVDRGILAVESFGPPATLFALDLFSSFVSAVARAIEKPLKGQGEVRPYEPGNHGSWTSFNLHNTLLSQMAGEIQSTGLASLSEVYSTIIPSLSIESKLPLVDPIIELAREHARPQEERGDMKKVTEVYLKGADVNARARNGSTPLHYAAREGFISIVKLLVESGAKFDAMDSARMTPAMWAALEGEKEVLSYLWRKTNFNLRDKGGRTMLHHAVLGGRCGIVGVFEKGIDTEVRDLEGRTPLHLAALHVNEDALSTIINKLKANMEAMDNTGKQLPHLAAVGEEPKIMDKLLSTFGADINCVDENRDTPLHLVVREGKETAIEALMDRDPNSEARNEGKHL
ncbi:hypothetical protein FPRO05_03112 [Fusarium proliferatum]|uniref:Uncharacterized protein n=1 Tax=Gibberella intermedia TaxID=948311 RepID=A0A365N0L1_GIBIN|nr:hypothetical protein FPRO05_03112 [Fusarium proliferatum]